MTAIESLATPVPERKLHDLDRLWREFVAARAVAERSHSILDGILAGKAWGRWLRAFEAVP